MARISIQFSTEMLLPLESKEPQISAEYQITSRCIFQSWRLSVNRSFPWTALSFRFWWPKTLTKIHIKARLPLLKIPTIWISNERRILWTLLVHQGFAAAQEVLLTKLKLTRPKKLSFVFSRRVKGGRTQNTRKEATFSTSIISCGLRDRFPLFRQIVGSFKNTRRPGLLRD